MTVEGNEFVLEMGKNDDLLHIVNFYNLEYDNNGHFFRWTGNESEIIMPFNNKSLDKLCVDMDCWRPENIPPPHVSITVNKNEVFNELVKGRQMIVIDTDKRINCKSNNVVIKSDTWIPFLANEKFDDGRELGVKIYSIQAKFR